MAIGALDITETDVVAGQKIFASTETSRIAEIEAWANAQVVGKAMDLDSAQTVLAVKDFSGGDRCKVKKQTAGNDTQQAASTSFVKEAVDALGVHTPSAYAGEKSITLPNGLIMKFGRKAITTTGAYAVTFADDAVAFFPNACLHAQVSLFDSDATGGNNAPVVKSYNATTLIFYTPNTTGIEAVEWYAIGY